MKSKFKSQKSEVRNQKSKRRETKSGDDSALSTPNSALIYGVSPVYELLRANSRKIEKIYASEGAQKRRLAEILKLARENNIRIQKVSRDELNKIAGEGANHQGVIAFTASAEYEDADELLEEISAKENSLSIVLDGIEDPRNLGAILRTAECAGVDGVFIPEHRAAHLTDTVVKTSAGATEHLKIAKATNLNRLIEQLKENHIWTVGTSMDATMDYTDWDWKTPSALVLGSEGKGLHRLTAEKCDILVKIPLLGNIESLNVSVAAGVILFEAVRQRTKDKEQKTKD